MENNNLYILALWLETIGFGLSATLVLLIKWNGLNKLKRLLKIFIHKMPDKVSYLLNYTAYFGRSVFKHAKEVRRIQYKEYAKTSIFYFIGAHIYYRILLVLSTFFLIMLLPLISLFYLFKYLSEDNATTNMLIVVGGVMIMAGLIIELVIAGS